MTSPIKTQMLYQEHISITNKLEDYPMTTDELQKYIEIKANETKKKAMPKSVSNTIYKVIKEFNYTRKGNNASSDVGYFERDLENALKDKYPSVYAAIHDTAYTILGEEKQYLIVLQTDEFQDQHIVFGVKFFQKEGEEGEEGEEMYRVGTYYVPNTDVSRNQMNRRLVF